MGPELPHAVRAAPGKYGGALLPGEGDRYSTTLAVNFWHLYFQWKS